MHNAQPPPRPLCLPDYDSPQPDSSEDQVSAAVGRGLTALLDPPETTVNHPPLDLQGEAGYVDTCLPTYPLSENFRHSGWADWRKRIATAQRAALLGNIRRRAFCQCGSGFHLFRHASQTGRFKIVPDHCHDRYCFPCSRDRAFRIRERLTTHLEGRTCRLISLTLRHSDATLTEQLDRLVGSFRKLRSTPFWKNHVTGGLFLIEYHVSSKDGCWHPHLHVITEGRFMQQSALASTWLKITGDSHIVDVRLIRQAQEVCGYVTKYVTKPLPVSVLSDPARLVEAIRACKGRKMLHAFGEWQSWKLVRVETSGDWLHVCHSSQPEWELPPHLAEALREARMIRDATTPEASTEFGQEQETPGHDPPLTPAEQKRAARKKADAAQLRLRQPA